MTMGWPPSFSGPHLFLCKTRGRISKASSKLVLKPAENWVDQSTAFFWETWSKRGGAVEGHGHSQRFWHLPVFHESHVRGFIFLAHQTPSSPSNALQGSLHWAQWWDSEVWQRGKAKVWKGRVWLWISVVPYTGLMTWQSAVSLDRHLALGHWGSWCHLTGWASSTLGGTRIDILGHCGCG